MGAQVLHDFVDIAAVLDGHAGAEGNRGPLRAERRLVDGGFGEDHACVVLIPVGSALDAAGIALDEHAMAGGGLDIEHHVSLLGERQGPPRNVADHHLSIARGGAGGGEGAAMFHHPIGFAAGVRGLVEAKPFQAGSGGGYGGGERAQFHRDVGHYDVHEVDAAVEPLSAGVGCSLGDAAHLLQDFAVEAAQKKRISGGTILLPLLTGTEFGGAAIQVFGNLTRHQVAVLVTAFVRSAFDMKVDPTRGRIAIGGAKGLDGLARRPLAGGGCFVETHALKPRFAAHGPAGAGGQQDRVLRAAGDEFQRQPGPRLRTAHRGRVDVPWRRSHGDRGAHGDRGTVEILHRKAFGEYPAAELISFADGQRDGRRTNHGSAARIRRLQAQRLALAVQHLRVGRCGSAQGGPAVAGFIERALE